MHETEIKILEIDREAVESKLISMGAKKVFDDEIHALYYDTADSSVGARKAAFRLRKEGSKAVLTFKKHIGDEGAKIREEKEVDVSDFGVMRSILESLGFHVWLEMKKHRTSYKLAGVRFELDDYRAPHDYIPGFLEIEGPDIDAVYGAAEKLGFEKGLCKPWDSRQLAQYYSSRMKKP